MSRFGNAIWIAMALACGSVLAEDIRWAPDIPTARRASMEYKVPLLIHFYGDDCLPCKVLEQNVLSKAEVIDTLNKFFICVRVNATHQRQTAAEYGVHSWPTDVFISPDGKTLDQGVCKQNAGEYLAALQNIAIMNRDRNVVLAAQQTQSANQVTTQQMAYALPAQQPDLRPNNLTSHLPPAGADRTLNPNGPNFYTQGSGTGLQQLPHSLGPNAGVTSGPMLAQDQPQAVTTAVQAGKNQFVGASAPNVASANQGYLPLPNSAAQSPYGSQAPTAFSQALAAQPQMPSMAAAVAAQDKSANTAWSNPNIGYSTTTQSFDNPHFAPAQPANPVMAQPAIHSSLAASTASHASLPVPANVASTNNVASTPASAQTPAGTSAQKIPASTVSFQSDSKAAAQSNQSGSFIQSPRSSTPQTAAAIEGFCPVALHTRGAWVKGDPQFAVRHRGQIYWLSSKQAMDDFLKHPDSSSPLMSGYDPMIFLNEGKLVDGSIQYGLHEQVSGTILLFSSAESKRAYEQNFELYTKALETVLKSAGVSVRGE